MMNGSNEPSGQWPRDKTGREIRVGDTLKIFHFVGARKKRHYMYKYVRGAGHGRLVVDHLSPSDGCMFIAMRGQLLRDTEIVQGLGGVYDGQDFFDRPKVIKRGEKS